MKRIIIVLAVLGLIIVSSSLYTVNETQVAIKLRLGEIVAVEDRAYEKIEEMISSRKN